MHNKQLYVLYQGLTVGTTGKSRADEHLGYPRKDHSRATLNRQEKAESRVEKPLDGRRNGSRMSERRVSTSYDTFWLRLCC